MVWRNDGAKRNALDASAFIVYLGLAYNILTPAKALSGATYKLKKASASADRIFQVIDNNSIINEKINATDSRLKKKLSLIK